MGKVMMMVYQLMLLLLLQWNNYLARLKGLAKKKLNRLPPLFFSLFLLQRNTLKEEMFHSHREKVYIEIRKGEIEG